MEELRFIHELFPRTSREDDAPRFLRFSAGSLPHILVSGTFECHALSQEPKEIQAPFQ